MIPHRTIALALLVVVAGTGLFAQPSGSSPGMLPRALFGEQWRRYATTPETTTTHVEGDLRTILPDFAVNDLRAALHPQRGVFASALAERAGVHVARASDAALPTASLYAGHEISWSYRPDAAAYLRLRLLDLVVGEWSRDPSSIAWSQDDSSDRWLPSPLAYPNAFSRYDGLLPSVLLMIARGMTTIDDPLPPIERATFHAGSLDRSILGQVNRAQWDSVATDIRNRLTDAAIDSIVGPDNGLLRALLRHRVDNLPAIVDEFYRSVVRCTLLTGTEGDDSVYVKVQQRHLLAITVMDRHDPGRRIERSLNSAASEEVRILLGRGDDIVAIEGAPSSAIAIIVETWGNEPSLISRQRASERWTDQRPSFVRMGRQDPPTSFDTRHDWGVETHFEPLFDITPEDALFIGGGPVTTRYAYRSAPYRSRMGVQAGVALRTLGARIDVFSDIRNILPGLRLGIFGHFSEIDVVRFYGLGNETTFDRAASRAGNYEAKQRDISFRIEAGMPTVVGIELTAGAGVLFNRSSASPGTILETALVSGQPRTFNAGSLSLGIATRNDDIPLLPTNSFRFALQATHYPAMLQNRESFDRITADAALTRGLPDSSLIIALHGQGSVVDGKHPWFLGAFLGGTRSLRGYDRQRFVGDRSVMGSAEVRLPVGSVEFLWTHDVGLLTFAEAGRVYLDGQSSDRWHSSVGAGVWLLPKRTPYLLVVSVARSSEQWSLYATLGFPW